MTAASRRSFPLIPRRRLAGAQFGNRRSLRRGTGDEVAGSRPYRPGDHIAWIDWAASARLSSARGSDEFVVREYLAEQAPCVVLVTDRRPSMAIYPPPFPWLDKSTALTVASRAIARSAVGARGRLAYVDHAAHRPLWASSVRRGPTDPLERRLAEPAFDAPEDGLQRSLELLDRHCGLFPAGTFVFVVSDFLGPLARRAWVRVRALRWDVTPVVVQDPVWEQTFPPVGGIVVPLADPATGRQADVWISRSDARRRAQANEQRLEETLAGFRRLAFDPVVVGQSGEDAILAGFAAWAERRQRLGRRRR